MFGKKAVLSSIVFSVLVAGAVVAAEKMKGYQVGSEVQAFTLKDSEGKEHDLSEMLGKNVVVISFWNFQCPVSRAYDQRYNDLLAKYEDKDVSILAIDSNSINEVERIQAFLKKEELDFTVLKDWENKIADQFGAQVTPHVYVIGKDKKVKFIGPIDDSQDTRRISKQYVVAAVDALLAGKEVEEAEVKPFGCGIKRVN